MTTSPKIGERAHLRAATEGAPAMNRFRVDVTRGDIDEGYAPSSSVSPLALAVRRLFPDALVVAVGVHTMGVWLDREWHDYRLPSGVARNQMDMIAKRPVEPFQFWLSDDDRINNVA